VITRFSLGSHCEGGVLVVRYVAQVAHVAYPRMFESRCKRRTGSPWVPLVESGRRSNRQSSATLRHPPVSSRALAIWSSELCAKPPPYGNKVPRLVDDASLSAPQRPPPARTTDPPFLLIQCFHYMTWGINSFVPSCNRKLLMASKSSLKSENDQCCCLLRFSLDERLALACST